MIHGRPWHTELFLLWRIRNELNNSLLVPSPSKPLSRRDRESLEIHIMKVADFCEALKNMFGSSIDYLPEKMCSHLSEMKWKTWNEPPDYVNTDEEILKYYYEYIPVLQEIVEKVLESARLHGVGDCGNQYPPIEQVLKAVGIPKEPAEKVSMGM